LPALIGLLVDIRVKNFRKERKKPPHQFRKNCDTILAPYSTPTFYTPYDNSSSLEKFSFTAHTRKDRPVQCPIVKFCTRKKNQHQKQKKKVLTAITWKCIEATSKRLRVIRQRLNQRQQQLKITVSRYAALEFGAFIEGAPQKIQKLPTVRV